jgi:hypothetical protein
LENSKENCWEKIVAFLVAAMNHGRNISGVRVRNGL